MDSFTPQTPEDEIEALLRRRRQTPDPAWVRSTEERLLPARRRRWQPQWGFSPPRFGAALAVAGAALLLILSLAGAGPLGGADQSVEAKRACEMVTVTRIQRVPAIAEGADGELTVTYSRQPVQRVERRCR